jgi:ATP-dependent RNA helicase RhlE
VSFSDFNFHSGINGALKAAGFTEPTPVQAQTIPVILGGKDVMGLAQTGTGKTAAFVLPMIQRLEKSRFGTRALIVVPTRELAEQVHEVVRQFGKPLGLRSTTVYGGASMHRQVRELRDGVDIVVACPGRLLDHVQQRTINLQHIEMLVLDEADQMFDMGFLPAIRRIVNALPKQRQSLLFSATMPDEIKHLALQVLHNPQIMQVDRSAPATTVSHALFSVTQDNKVQLLMHLLKEASTDSVLIFTRTKHRAKRLAQQLSGQGYESTCLQGNLSQNRRQEAMEGFRKGKYRILVATDIASRGIDIASISHVINFDMPSTVEAYTHRIGRTGRASREGDAITFVTQDDLSLVRQIERVLGKPIPRRTADLPKQVVTDKTQKLDYRPAREPRHGGGRRQGPRSDQRGSSSENRPRRHGQGHAHGQGQRNRYSQRSAPY